MKAIETIYKGYRFRSRLEARWAVYLDQIGWAWDYEHEGFDLGPAGLYLPDFLLRSDGHSKSEGGAPGTPMLYLEIKPTEPTEAELKKAEYLARHTQVPAVFGIGLPDPYKISYGLDGYESHEVYSEVDGKCLETGRTEVGYMPDLASLNHYCYHKWGRPGWLMYSDQPDDEDFAACNAAKSARFEFGESGAPTARGFV
jgi:hypothetical protein